MNVSKDSRDSLRINIPLEEALKIGKLLGSQYDAVALCRDGHRSSHMIEQAMIAGIISTGGNVYLAGEAPAPAMPFTRSGCDCYVSIAADEPEQIGGIVIHNPDGSYFDESQIHSLMSKEVRIYYPEYSGLGQTHKAYGLIGRYEGALMKFVKKCNCQVVMDGTYTMPTSVASRMLINNDSDIIIVNRSGITSIKTIDEYYYYDIIHTMESYAGSIAVALNNDGSRIVTFDEERRRINNHVLGAMFAEELSPSQVTAPIDVSLAVDDALGPGGIVVKSERNIKHVVDHMVANKSGFGMDSYGRFVFTDLSYSPDGIAALLKLGEMSEEEKLCDRVDRIPEYPRLKERILTTASEEEFMNALLMEISGVDYDSMIRMGAIRLEFDNGWILLDVNCAEQYVDVTCESRDKAYVVGLMDIGKNIVNSAIRELD